MNEKLFFCWNNFDDEIKNKQLSYRVNSRTLWKALLKEFPIELESNLIKLDELFTKLNKFSIENHLDIVHPLRVTYSALGIIQSLNKEKIINIGLIHNAIELNIIDVFDLDNEILKIIKILTIDRSREKDLKYRKDYYDNIQDYSNDLLIFKTLDKLDNLFVWPFMNIEQYHIDVIKDEILPRVKKINLKLYDYVNRLTNYVTDDIVKQKFVKKYKISEHLK